MQWVRGARIKNLDIINIKIKAKVMNRCSAVGKRARIKNLDIINIKIKAKVMNRCSAVGIEDL